MDSDALKRELQTIESETLNENATTEHHKHTLLLNRAEIIASAAIRGEASPAEWRGVKTDAFAAERAPLNDRLLKLKSNSLLLCRQQTQSMRFD